MGCSNSLMNSKKSDDNQTIVHLSDLVFAMEAMGFEFSDSHRFNDMFNSMSRVQFSASSAIPIEKVCTYFGEPNNKSLMRILNIGGSSSIDFQNFVFVLWNFATMEDYLGMYIVIYIIYYNVISEMHMLI